MARLPSGNVVETEFERSSDAERRFRTARCANLYRQFKQRGMAALSAAVTRVLLEKLQRREARVEFVPLNRRYLQLALLLCVA